MGWRRIKPQGFWEGSGPGEHAGGKIVRRWVESEITEPEAVALLREAIIEAEVEQREDQISNRAILDDLHWYGRRLTHGPRPKRRKRGL